MRGRHGHRFLCGRRTDRPVLFFLHEPQQLRLELQWDLTDLIEKHRSATRCLDYALAITGYAGPEAGSEPAGTVYIGYHSPLGVWSHRAVLPGNRTAVKERAVYAALNFLRLKLDKYKVYDLLESLRC